MPVEKDEHKIGGGPILLRGREPKTGEATQMASTAFNDAVLIVALAWAFLFFLTFSLRKFNV